MLTSSCVKIKTQTPGIPNLPLSPTNTPFIPPSEHIFMLAASNASTEEKAKADYQTNNDGHDEVPIQNMIDALPENGIRTVLLVGNFIKGNASGIAIPSNTTIILNGSIMLAKNINQDASIFVNANNIEGNTNINILDGTLIGNEENNKSGNQYAIIFNKVKNTTVDCWIHGFKTADELTIDSNIKFINRNYDDKYTPRVQFISHCESITDFVPATNLSTNSTHIEGDKSIQFFSTGNSVLTIFSTKVFDLRFYPLLTLKYKVISGNVTQYSANLVMSLVNSRLNLFQNLYTHTLQSEIYDLGDNGWQLAIIDLTTIDWTTFNSTPDDFLRDVTFSIRLDNSTNILLDDIYAIRGLPRAVITQVFDDGYSTDYTEGTYMNKYGFKGVSAIIPYYEIMNLTNRLSKTQLDTLYSNGWDLCNHSFTHPLRSLSPGDQWIEDTAGRAWLELQGVAAPTLRPH